MYIYVCKTLVNCIYFIYYCKQVVEEVIRMANVSSFVFRKAVNEVDYKGTWLKFLRKLLISVSFYFILVPRKNCSI